MDGHCSRSNHQAPSHAAGSLRTAGFDRDGAGRSLPGQRGGICHLGIRSHGHVNGYRVAVGEDAASDQRALFPPAIGERPQRVRGAVCPGHPGAMFSGIAIPSATGEGHQARCGTEPRVGRLPLCGGAIAERALDIARCFSVLLGELPDPPANPTCGCMVAPTCVGWPLCPECPQGWGDFDSGLLARFGDR